MAVDTVAKRASTINHGGRFWKGKNIVASGSLTLSDRMQIACVYNGNAPSAASGRIMASLAAGGGLAGTGGQAGDSGGLAG